MSLAKTGEKKACHNVLFNFPCRPPKKKKKKEEEELDPEAAEAILDAADDEAARAAKAAKVAKAKAEKGDSSKEAGEGDKDEGEDKEGEKPEAPDFIQNEDLFKLEPKRPKVKSNVRSKPKPNK